MNVNWTNYDSFSSKQNIEEYIIGGVLDINLYDFLPSPKKTVEWQLKKKFSQEEAVEQNRLHFPPLDNNGQINWQQATENKVQFSLPPHIYIHPDDICRVAYHDGLHWTSDTIDDIKMDLETKAISFTTKRLAPFAYL